MLKALSLVPTTIHMHKENESAHNGMTITPVICEVRQEFKSILSYIEGSRLAYAIETIPCLKEQTQKEWKGRPGIHPSVYKLSDRAPAQYAPSPGLHLKDSRTKDSDNVMIAKHDH